MKTSKKSAVQIIIDQVNAPSKTATSQEDIPGEDIGPRPAVFRVRANVDLYAVAHFEVKAADEKEAEANAKQILDGPEFTITRHSNDGVSFLIDVQPDLIEYEILEIQEGEFDL